MKDNNNKFIGFRRFLSYFLKKYSCFDKAHLLESLFIENYCRCLLFYYYVYYCILFTFVCMTGPNYLRHSKFFTD